MQTWEYVLVPVLDAKGLRKNSGEVPAERLNALGAQGWEVISISMNTGDLGAWPMALLKRATG